MCAGKYTVGLGQQAMTFCGDREDVVSMAATAVLRLLENSGVKLTDIGRYMSTTVVRVQRVLGGCDKEDVVPMAAAAMLWLLENSGLTPTDIGS